MPIDTSQVQQFSDTDILNIYRQALATGAFRQSYTINGRTMQIPDAKTCLAIITAMETRIQDDANYANNEGGNVAVTSFDEPA